MADIQFRNLDIAMEKKELQKELIKWFKVASNHLTKIPSDLNSQIQVLNSLRRDVYEDINQLQHKALLISAASYLSKCYPKIDQWTWHPMQTSHEDYADLTGFEKGKVILNAEATTSLNPKGTIDSRIRDTLTSLSTKRGDKYYFVQTESMEQRALTKVQKLNFKIEVVVI